MIALPPLEYLARIAVTVLINSLWEDAILVATVWFLLRTTRETNASTRYFSWLVTLIAAMALPIVTRHCFRARRNPHVSSQTPQPPQTGSLSRTYPRLQTPRRA